MLGNVTGNWPEVGEISVENFVYCYC